MVKYIIAKCCAWQKNVPPDISTPNSHVNIKVADGIKLANQLILGWGDNPELSRWSNVITKVIRSGRRKLRSQRI